MEKVFGQRKPAGAQPETGRHSDEVSLLTALIGIQGEIAEAGLDLDAIMALVTRHLVELLEADGAAIEMAEGDDMVYCAASGTMEKHVGMHIPMQGSLSGLCVQSGEVLRCDDAETDPRVDVEVCRKVGVRSMIVVPLHHEKRFVGVLKVGASQPSYFTEGDACTMRLLAGMIGTAMERSAEHKLRHQLMQELESASKRLQELATIDALTGLSNRRHFDSALHDAFAQEMRRKSPLSLVMIDLDKLKVYNDTFGHPAGDRVLQQVAATLRGQVRAHEVVARFGGEEFAVILPGSDAANAMIMAKRLRVAIEDADWPQTPVTISVGVATSTPDTANARALLDEADEALYRSKQHGRNCVTHYQEDDQDKD